VPLSICRRNASDGIEHRMADWRAWDDAERYGWILGADILYGESMHPHLRRIREKNLAPGGTALLADPFRAPALRLLEAMETDGWAVSCSRQTVGGEGSPPPVGVFGVRRPE
jgi:methyltransferase-like protein 23